ncbi:MAG TPA: PQQ-dependent sugar dehydrogenase [Alphaproteobacteria bacterium]|nr:PQQ-dependent sugar dehydrogenase [Alphaproteobacteria bacterium]
MRFIFLLVLIGLIGASGFGYGYVSGERNGSFADRWVTRISRNIDELRGVPTPEQRAVARIESTFIRFRGTIYGLPDSHYTGGGGLTVWNANLLLVDKEGTIWRFEDGEGLRQTRIVTPEHGDDAYAEIARTPPYDQLRHKPHQLRYNDILFVDMPEFRGLLISYNFFDADRICYGNRIAKLSIPASITRPQDVESTAADWEILFDSQPCLPFRPSGTALEGIQAGGRMDLHPDGRIIYSNGDFALDGLTAPDIGLMDPNSVYGKVLAIDIETGEPTVLASGHRNIGGVAIDRNGEIWTVEHGVRGGDELNHIKPGENHGWPRESMGTLYSGQPFPTDGVVGRHDRYDRPAFAWLPSAAPASLDAIDDFHPAWDGGLLVGALSSPLYGQSLYHVRTEGETVVFVERIRIGRRVRYVQQWGDRIALWLDPTDLLILEQEERLDPLGSALARLNESHADVANEAVATLRACNECHSFEQHVHMAGPSLNGVIGRNVAGTGFTGYSEALRAVGGAWTADRLKAYLLDPESFAPGTVMPSMGLTEGAELDALVSALADMDTVNDEHLKY